MLNLKKLEEAERLDMLHAWQAHRKWCLELAVKAGANIENMFERADKIGAYILTVSEIEKRNQPKAE